MAFFDDPKVLTAHIRHSFITSDDTGMCELIMVNEDLDTEIKIDHKFSKRSLRMGSKHPPIDHLIHHGAKSFDIHASPSLPRRPPLKNNGNMFEAVEKKKVKKGVKTVVWNNENTVPFDPDMFPRREVVKKEKSSEPSALAMLLAEHSKISANPFYKFSKFNGENHGIGVTNTYEIFLSFSKTPLFPVMVTVLHNATVADLIGLTLWKYVESTPGPVKLKSVRSYSLMIAEEDGDIDMDLPELEKEDRVAKFKFKHLGLVAKRSVESSGASSVSPPRPVVKVFYEHGGFSTLAIDDYKIDMGEILSRVIRKRRLQIHGYELERKDSPGFPVDLSSTLEFQKTLDFVLVKNLGRIRVPSTSSKGEDTTDLLDVKDELTFYQYKPYNVILVNKVRSNSEVILGISGDQVEVEPVGHSTKHFFPRSNKSQKPVTYEMKKICCCDVMDDKSPSKNVFRIVRQSKDGSYKNMDFEAPSAITKEIVRKMTLILDGLSGGVRSEYLEWKESSKTRKGTKSLI